MTRFAILLAAGTLALACGRYGAPERVLPDDPPPPPAEVSPLIDPDPADSAVEFPEETEEP